MAIIVLAGTNRPGARTRKLAGHVVELLAPLAKTVAESVDLLDLGALGQDIYSPSSYKDKPEWFGRYQRAVLEASGMVVLTPEYNGSFPGVLKYFIDMLQFPESLRLMPVAFIGLAAGSFGALRSVEQLELIFNYRSAHIYGERLFIPGISNVLLENGALSGEYEERLVRQLTGFVRFVAKVRADG